MPWSHAAEVYEVNENKASGKSHLPDDGITAEDAVELSSPYSLQAAYSDKKATCKGTWMTKYKLHWYDTEVWNYSIVLEKREKEWTKFATGYLAQGEWITTTIIIIYLPTMWNSVR